MKRIYKLISASGKQVLSDTPGTLGGHSKLKIFGQLDCPSALRYIAKGHYVKHRVFFASMLDALCAGYRPCAICMPNTYKAWKNCKLGSIKMKVVSLQKSLRSLKRCVINRSLSELPETFFLDCRLD